MSRAAKRIAIKDDTVAGALQAIEDCFERSWTDGLTVVPPTEERVQWMLQGTRRSPDDVVGVIPPRMGRATVEAIATNAVMAGCRLEYLPVVITALEAMLDDSFHLNGVQATTHNCAPLVIVNGPIRRDIGMNAGTNVFGHGNRANATIGRAIRLALINLGGGHPESGSKSTLGHPGRYTYCIAENEEESPWEPLQVERGLQRGESAVTVFACEAPHHIGRGLPAIAAHMAAPGGNPSPAGGNRGSTLASTGPGDRTEGLVQAGCTDLPVREGPPPAVELAPGEGRAG